MPNHILRFLKFIKSGNDKGIFHWDKLIIQKELGVSKGKTDSIIKQCKSEGLVLILSKSGILNFEISENGKKYILENKEEVFRIKYVPYITIILAVLGIIGFKTCSDVTPSSPSNSQNTFRNSDSVTYSEDKCDRPAFKNDTGYTFKLLITKYPEYNKMPIGKILKNRYATIKEVELPNIEIKYCSNYQVNVDSAKYYQAINNCDFLIYGNYIQKGESYSTNQINFNFVLDKSYDIGIANIALDEKYVDINSIEDIRQGKGQEKYDYIVYFVGGLAYYKQNNYEKAVNFFKKSLSFNATGIANYYLSLCFFQWKDYSNSLKYINLSISLDPRNDKYLDRKKLIVQLQQMSSNLTTRSDNPNMGYLYYIQKKYDSSILYLEQKIIKDSMSAIPYYYLARSYRERASLRNDFPSNYFRRYFWALNKSIRLIKKNPNVSDQYQLFSLILEENSVVDYFVRNDITEEIRLKIKTASQDLLNTNFEKLVTDIQELKSFQLDVDTKWYTDGFAFLFSGELHYLID
ncbi:MAG: hypothetical protein ABJA78_06865 [Ferruginibacter sp.]